MGRWDSLNGTGRFWYFRFDFACDYHRGSVPCFIFKTRVYSMQSHLFLYDRCLLGIIRSDLLIACVLRYTCETLFLGFLIYYRLEALLLVHPFRVWFVILKVILHIYAIWTWGYERDVSSSSRVSCSKTLHGLICFTTYVIIYRSAGLLWKLGFVNYPILITFHR